MRQVDELSFGKFVVHILMGPQDGQSRRRLETQGRMAHWKDRIKIFRFIKIVFLKPL